MANYDDFDDDLMEVYITEATEHIQVAEEVLLTVEKQGKSFDISLINEAFRSVHTVKGGASFYNLDNINNLAHEVENILDLMRNGKLLPDVSSMDPILKSIDLLKNFLEDPKNSNKYNIAPILKELKAIKEVKEKVKEKKVKEEVKEEAEEKAEEEAKEEIKKEKEPQKSEKSIIEKITDISEKETNIRKFEVHTKSHTVEFEYDYNDLKRQRKPGNFLYFIYVDLIKDCQKKHRTPLDLIQKAAFVGEIITSTFHIEMITEADGEPASMPVYLIYQSALELRHLLRVLDLPEISISEWEEGISEEDDGTKPVTEEKTKKESEEHEHEPLLPVKAEAHYVKHLEDEKHEVTSDTLITHLPAVKEFKEKKVETSLRIDIKLLDKLMSLAGELVLSRNQLMQMIAKNDVTTINNIAQRINIITTELQENIMRTRMQPVGNVFNKFPRVVRDLSKSLGKEVELTIKGEEVELDKNMVENLGDPLTHLVRNAVDHGIELPSIRKSKGKEITGKLLLAAYHEGGQVNIDITDDGSGMDPQKLKSKAIEKGIINPIDAENMTDRDALNLIFLPGFSTATQVTEVSGRGVGMDVVRTNFEKIGGIIDIDSGIGEGTTINIKLPLTLAIIPCLIVKSRTERFAIPQMNLVELLKIKATEVKDKIESIHGLEVFRLRGHLLPLIRLNSVLYNDDIDMDQNKKDINIVVLAAGNIKYGLIVDGLNDSEEIVVKPLGRHLKDCKCYAGATIMGDGRVALILDVQGIANYSELMTEEDLESIEEKEKKEDLAANDMQSILLFNNGTVEQFGISLALVSRIDRINTAEVETIGGRDLIKYRGSSLPVIKLEKYLTMETPDLQNTLYVILFKIQEKEIGLIARNIVDTKDMNFDIDTRTLKQPGVLGSSIIDNKTTLFLDIFQITELAEPTWFKEREQVVVENNKKPCILLVEDSTFFRTHVSNYLTGQGYDVVEAVDGKDGFDKLCENKINLIITDIEMPVMNGYAFTKKVKSDPRFSGMKVIALTAMSGEEDMKKGIESGIDDYQIKLDRESLLDSVLTYLRGDSVTSSHFQY